MKKVILFGAFDLLHKGHEYFLREAKKKGDYLIVVVGREERIKKLKGEIPLISERERVAEIRKLGVADKVVLGDKKDRYKVLREVKPEVICLGYDQKANIEKLKKFGKIIRLNSYSEKKYKSSLIKKKIILRGKLFSGRKEGRYFMKIYQDKIKKIIGVEAYLGTLNLRIDDKVEEFLKGVKKYKVEGFSEGGKKFGGISLYKVMVEREEGWIVRPELNKYGRGVLEIISSVRLRSKLKIKDGDVIRIWKRKD